MRVIVPICRGMLGLGFYRDFHQGITEALRDLGHDPVVPSFAQIGQASASEAKSLALHVERSAALLDVCCWSYGFSEIAAAGGDGGAARPFERSDIAWLGMLFDHPYNQPIHAIRARRLLASYPDRGHPEQARLVYPGLQLASELFVPPAVRAANDRSADAVRAIDVLYVGNLDRGALQRAWRDTPAASAPERSDAEVRDAIADAALAEPERPLHLSVRPAIAALGELPPESYLYNHLRVVEWHLRHTFRRDAVLALARAGVRMRVVGGGWEGEDLPANVVRTARTDYDGLLRLAAQAKICLDASTYTEGANDRVFNYALNGTVCFTNAAGYLAPLFADGAMRFYSMKRLDGLVDDVRGLLQRPEALRAAGDAARARVLADHTWRNRLESVLPAMQ